jgi:putative nucleotidyltransferase with HDIG domain
MKRILFVDDEPRILEGLKRMLYPLRNEWQTEFASNGRDALRILSESEFDVLVTDVRMPDMSGIELLQEVVKQFPQVVRMVLSGTADQEITLRSVTLAHQYLVKPCDAATLHATVERAFRLRSMLEDPALKQLISRIRSLPSIPAVYTKLLEALRNPEVTPKDVGIIIAQDISMTAKILQLVNSAFFGISRHVTNPQAAAIYLGIDTLRALTLTISVFSLFDSQVSSAFSIQALQDHSVGVGTLAREIAKSMKMSKAAIDDAFTGGLLHDVGKLVLATNYREQYEDVIRLRCEAGVSAAAAELEIFGTSHAQVGAYLLWLWGLPDPVTDVVARHHSPVTEETATPGPVIAVHVADALVNHAAASLDMEWLKQLGLGDRLPEWQLLHDNLTEVAA